MRTTHLLLLGVICILLANCSRNNQDLPQPEPLTKLEAEKEIGKFVALAFKDKEGRKAILSGALKQETGDYSMRAATLIKAPALATTARSVSNTRLQSAVSKLTLLNRGNGPTVFYPRAETIQHRFRRARGLQTKYDAPRSMATTKRSVYGFWAGANNEDPPAEPEPEDPIDPICTCVLPYDPTDDAEPGFAIDTALYGTDGYPTPTTEPIIVLGSTYNSSTGFADGYVLDVADSSLVPIGGVAEEYAWEHDVLVVGVEETIEMTNWPMEAYGGYSGNSYSSNYTPPPSGRSLNETEYGGLIQITNLSEVESWVAGKLELMYNVLTVNGYLAKDNRKFPQVKRKFFRDSKWYDFEDRIFDWDTTAYGKQAFEEWCELDWGGGGPRVVNASFPAQCAGCPAKALTFTSKGGTYDRLGSGLVSFTDNKSVVYTMNSSNFKRK